MKLLRYGIIFMTCFLSTHILHARTVIDTLYTANHDCLIVTYDLSQDNNRYVLDFKDVRKKLGHRYRSKYRDLTEVVPFIFDRIGVYDGASFEGLSPQTFKTPPNVEYERTQEGFVNLEDQPSLVFTMESKREQLIKLPICLAHYRKKGRFKIFGVCELEVSLKKNTIRHAQPQMQNVEEIVTSTVEVEAENENVVEALSIIDRVQHRIELADRLPFEESLTYDIGQLMGLRNKVDDSGVVMKINDVLDAYDAKKRQLQDAEAADEAEQMAAMERKTMMAEQRAQAHADSIAAQTQKQTEKAQKRNIWTMIGSVVMLVLCFIGNTVFQHFRNLRNQRSMFEMQQQAARNAEYEAKQRIQRSIDNKMYEAKKKINSSIKDRKRQTDTSTNKSNSSRNFRI